MNEYLVTLFCASAVVALCGFAFIGKRLEGVAKVALGIILVASIISPLVSIGKELINIDIDKESFIGSDTLEQTAEEAFCRGLRLAIADELSVDSESIEVECVGFSAEKMNAERVRVTLHGSAALVDLSAVRRLVSENNLGECEVRIAIE